MTSSERAVAVSGGREAQRRRTRRALLEAAQRLLRTGASPTIDDVAAEADVSRRTVYLHFPTLDQLLLDAAVGLMSSTDVDTALDGAGDDPAARIEAVVRGTLATADETLPLGRQIIRLTVEKPDAPGPRRGVRRLEWIDRALEPARDRLDDDAYERLKAALAVVIGWEAMTVLRDVVALDRAKEVDTLVWTARALVAAALNPTGRPRKGRR
jgi:AcrR family transcriptional regulator